MSATVDSLHPRHTGSPIHFKASDKAIVLARQPRPILIVDTNITLDQTTYKGKQNNLNAVTLGNFIGAANASAQSILRTFDPNNIALQESDETHSLKELVRLFSADKIALYHWPYQVPVAQRKGGRKTKTRSSVPNSKYIAPFVPSIGELDRLASKAESLRGASKGDIANALAEEALPYAPPELAKGVGLIKKAESLKGASPQVLAQALAGEVMPYASPEQQAAFSQANSAVGTVNGARTAYQSGDKLGAAMALSQSGLVSLPIDDTCVGGEPISLFSGEELLQLQDATIEGPLPLAWSRTYRTSNANDCGLGVGWTHSFCDYIRLHPAKQTLTLHDTESRLIELPLPQEGERSHNPSQQLSVYRSSEHHFIVTPFDSPTGLQRHYERLPHEQDNTENHYRLSAIQDSHHNAYQFRYDGKRLIEIVSSQGKSTQLIYTACKHIAALIQRSEYDADVGSTLVSYEYNQQGDLSRAIDADGFHERYHYKQHIITQRELKSGYRFYFEWDTLTPEARCLHQWGDEINGQPTYDYRFKWDPANRQVLMTDTRGGQQIYRFNEQAKLIYHQDAEGGETHYHFDEQEQLTKITYPDTSHEAFRFNDNGLCIAETNRAGQTTTFECDKQGRVCASENEQGQRWLREYNDHNQVVAIVNPEGQSTQYRYNQLGLLSSVINPLGASTTYLWDEQGQLVAIRDAEGRIQRYRYNDKRQLVAIHHAPNQVTHYQYNHRGQVSALTTPDDQTTHYTYTPLGLLNTVTDAAGRITQYDYDGLSQVTQRTLNKGTAFESILKYEYDGERNLIGLQNEKGERYHLEYDGNEKLIKEIGFDGKVTEYVYNKQGYVAQQIERSRVNDPKPVITDYQRNALGQLTQLSNADGVTHFAYNHTGQLTEAGNPHRQLKWRYNHLGQVTEEWQDEQVLQHRYDKAGNRHLTQLPNGDILRAHYNATHQLTDLTHIAKHNRQHESVLSLSYNAQGQEVKRHHGNSLTTLSQYDPQGRLSHCGVVQRKSSDNPTKALISHIAGAGNNDFVQRNLKHYHYNASNQLNKIEDQFKGTSTYHYDPLDRLIQVDGPIPEHILHDPANNVLAISQDKTKAEQQGKHAQIENNRLRVQGDTHYHFDAYGNRVLATQVGASKGNDSKDKSSKDTSNTGKIEYRYNTQHQLIAVKSDKGLSLFQYDALGRRCGKQHKDKNGTLTSTSYLWQGDNLLQETKTVKGEQESITQIYLFEPNEHKPLALIKDKRVYRYHNDHLGTPEALSDEKGNVVWYTALSSYGNLAIDFNDKIPEPHRADIEQPFRFQGQYYDSETGLHYNRHRYYDPSTASFLTQDPIKLKGGINNYRYVPNPISWVDPLGLSCKEDKEKSWGGAYTDTLGEMAKQTGENISKEQSELYKNTAGWGNVTQPIWKPTAAVGEYIGHTFGLIGGLFGNIHPKTREFWGMQKDGVVETGKLAGRAVKGDPEAAAKLTPLVAGGVILRKLPMGKGRKFKSLDDLNELKGTGKNVGDFRNIKNNNIEGIVKNIPKSASVRKLTPVSGKSQVGLEYKWKDGDGMTNRLRVHDPDPSHLGSNSASGWTARWQRGGKYYDPEAKKFQPKNAHRENSSKYDPDAANNTHIPIQTPSDSLIDIMRF